MTGRQRDLDNVSAGGAGLGRARGRSVGARERGRASVRGGVGTAGSAELGACRWGSSVSGSFFRFLLIFALQRQAAACFSSRCGRRRELRSGELPARLGKREVSLCRVELGAWCRPSGSGCAGLPYKRRLFYALQKQPAAPAVSPTAAVGDCRLSVWPLCNCSCCCFFYSRRPCVLIALASNGCGFSKS